jgi:hypothetical protein
VRGRFGGPEDFLVAALAGFGFDESGSSRSQLRHILQAFLLHQCQQGARPVLVVEDTPSLTPKVLAELLWVAQLEQDGRAAADIVLSGLPGLERIATAPAMGALSRRHQHLLELQPLYVDETSAYIRHRLSVAGVAEPDGLFAEAAISLIHDLTGGIPGLVDTLCETAIACAASADEPRVSAVSVQAAAGKLQQVSVSGVTRVQGSRRSDSKAVASSELGQLVVTDDDKVICEYSIRKERVLIGRRPENDVRLDFPTVSAYHALLLKDADGWVLIDLHSTNGTHVRSRPIRQHRMRGDETISIATLRITCSGLAHPSVKTGPAAGRRAAHEPLPTPQDIQQDDHAATVTPQDATAPDLSGNSPAPDKET